MEPDKRTYKRYDEEFKRSAVGMVNGGKALRQVAQELGVEVETLRYWCKRLRPKVAAKPRTAGELEAEVRALQQELQRVKNQRDILKKTLGILSNPNDNASNG
jgi:transposase